MWAPCASRTDATTSLPPSQGQQQQPQQQNLGVVRKSLEASFQAQHADADPERQAESFPSLHDLGEAPALSKLAERSSSFGLGRPPALNMFGERSSASSPAPFLEEHMGSKHKLLAVTTQLRIAVACLQECINTLAELQSDSFDQKNASLGLRESSFSSLTSHRHRNNNDKTTEEERSSLGELTPRTCNSKSEDELEQNQLEQEEAEQQKQEEEATQLASQQKGQQQNNRNSLGEHKQQQPLAQKQKGTTASHEEKMVPTLLENRAHNRSLLVQ